MYVAIVMRANYSILGHTAGTYMLVGAVAHGRAFL